MFFKQSGDLSRSYRVVTFRLREDGGFGYDDLTGDVAAIIRDLKEPRATIVGESFGGTIALQFAVRYPAMVERLVIVNSFPRFRGRLRINLARRFAAAMPFRVTWLVRFGASSLGLTADGVTGEDRRRFFDAVRTVKREGYVRRLELIAGLDIEDRLSDIEAATLFIAGEKDLLIRSVSEAHCMAARIPNATVKIVEGAGHACLLGDRVRLAELLGEWRRLAI